MKKIHKILISTSFILSNLFTTVLFSKLNKKSSEKFDLITDAVEAINSISKKGRFYKIFRDYNIEKDKIVIRTKCLSNKYRSKPDIKTKVLYLDTSKLDVKSVRFTSDKNDKGYILKSENGSRAYEKIALNDITKNKYNIA